MKTIGEFFNLKGKTAIVTGAANGIGKAIVARLAEVGCNLVLTDVDEKRLNEVAQLAKEKDVEVECYTFNLTEKEDIDDLVALKATRGEPSVSIEEYLKSED